MNSFMFRIIVLLFILFTTNAVSACGGCSGSPISGVSVAGPIFTIPAYTMDQGRASIGFGTSYINSGRLSSSQVNKLLRTRTHSDDNYGGLNSSFFATYGLTDKLNLLATMPYRINYDFHEIHDGSFERQGNSIGFGDLILLSKYKYLSRLTFQAALISGIKFPTGDSHVIADTGERFEARNQPGTGSFDPMIGLAFSKQLKSVALDSSVLYTLSTEGAQNTTTGDSVNIGLGMSYPINHSHSDQFHHEHEHGSNKSTLEKLFPEHLLGQHLTWDLILESVGRWEEKPEINGTKDPNHGGFTVFVYPGLRMTINKSVVCNLNIGLPLLQALNGEQGGTDFQMFFGMATAL